ncbi:MAG: hypothetical protein K6F82_00745 [Sphaerochaetaceae bacterium]|nr:hypothetical protein [Sphaerochaetaceae bacterium]
MHIKRIVILLFVLVFAVFPAFCLNSLREALPGLSEEEIQSLLNGETIKAYTVKGDKTAVLAAANSIAYNMASDTQDLDYAFSEALVSFVPYNDEFKSMTEDEIYLELFNTMQKISTVVGITYRSHSSGGEEEVLFTDAYMLSSSNKKNRIDDPVYDSVPNRTSSYAYLKDNRFGGNVYKIEYYAYGNEIFLEITNTKTMKYMGFSCVAANALHMYVDAVMTEEGVVVYGLAVVYNQKPTVNVLVTSVDLPSAFMKRLTSLKDWFIESVI